MSRHSPFFPKRSLGQNFLINPNIARRIITSCDLQPTDTVLEIGAGKGALTLPLSSRVRKVIAVEKDDYLASQLQQTFGQTNVEIVHADFLAYPLEQLPENIKIIGNLPYNIATPIIEKVLGHRTKFTVFYMTVQLEYGQRIAAQPNSKRYGSWSCFVQYYGEPRILFKIKNSAFQPVPKVQSCFLRLDFTQKQKHAALDEQGLFKLIRACFGQRRKILQNALSCVLRKEEIGRLLQETGLDPKSRAETISLEKYVQLSNRLTQEEKKGRKIFIA